MRADLAMAIHFHQPVGNFDNVIEGACDKCYIPFLETLKKYPDIKMTFHFTGCLLEWVEYNRPELLDLVKDMVRKGQIEMMSGGFYEPIFASIPERDRLAQIKLLNQYVEDKFGYAPRGAWVAERIWEPGLPSVYSDAGIKYVILDDTHFLYSGIGKEATYGYYVTEDNGKTVAVFPSDKVLRYSMPFKLPHESMDYMRKVTENKGNPTFVYGDDGEKFGEWPGTHKWVFEEKWLERFFDETMNNQDWLKTVHLSYCYGEKQPLGRVYFPTSSYEEMLEWALPANSQEHMEDMLEDLKHSGKEEFYKPFIRGGFWRNFLSKYPESNNMNKKMVYVSDKLEDLKAKGKVKDQGKLDDAEKNLFRGQCNCAYWHGVFGGLYLFHLRRSIYHHLIKSERQINELIHGDKDFCESNILDIDADGNDEAVFANKEISICLDPAEGGVIKEFDAMISGQNLINSLARRKEAYHRKILQKLHEGGQDDTGEVKTIHDGIQQVDEGVGENLTYDWYNRYSFIDHFISGEVTISDIAKCAYREDGDFVAGAYALDVKETASGVNAVMEREGSVCSGRIFVSKEVSIQKTGSRVSVKYSIENRSGAEMNTVFAPEINITMPDADASKYSFYLDGKASDTGLSREADLGPAKEAEIRDDSGYLSLSLSSSEKCSFWHFPVMTVSQSEKAYELNYQSSAILPRIPLKMAPGEKRELIFVLEAIQ